MKITLIFALIQVALLVVGEFGLIGWVTPYHTDIAVPEGFARRMLAGEAPYCDFVVEYPPLALPFFGLAGWFGPKHEGFTWFFAAEVLVCHTATLVLVARYPGRDPTVPGPTARLAWFVAFGLTLWPVMLTRYDPIPTFFAFAAVVAWRAGRPAGAGVWAGLGVLVKLFPGFVLLPQVARDWLGIGSASASARARLGLGVTVGLGVLLWGVVGGSGAWASVRYHIDRKVEVESVLAGPIFLTDALLGRAPVILFNFGAYHLMGDLADFSSLMSLPLLGFALLFVCSRASAGDDPVRPACGCLVAFIVTNKVLSPQYLIWLIPFVATLGGPRAGRVRVLFAVACVLTTVDYPYFFFDLVAARPLAVLIVGARNLVLLLIARDVWLPDRRDGHPTA